MEASEQFLIRHAQVGHHQGILSTVFLRVVYRPRQVVLLLLTDLKGVLYTQNDAIHNRASCKCQEDTYRNLKNQNGASSS